MIYLFVDVHSLKQVLFLVFFLQYGLYIYALFFPQKPYSCLCQHSCTDWKAIFIQVEIRVMQLAHKTVASGSLCKHRARGKFQKTTEIFST